MSLPMKWYCSSRVGHVGGVVLTALVEQVSERRQVATRPATRSICPARQGISIPKYGASG
jgi:hypothetical protein